MEKQQKLEELISELLVLLDQDLSDPHLKDTPKRVAKWFLSFFYPEQHSIRTFPEKQTSSEVEVSNIKFYSLCKHHLLPFFGTATVRYKPAGKILGLSKIARIVQKNASKLQLQEDLARDIALEIKKLTNAEWVEVEMEARHLCMEMRGVKQDAITKTKFRV